MKLCFSNIFGFSDFLHNSWTPGAVVPVVVCMPHKNLTNVYKTGSGAFEADTMWFFVGFLRFSGLS